MIIPEYSNNLQKSPEPSFSCAVVSLRPAEDVLMHTEDELMPAEDILTLTEDELMPAEDELSHAEALLRNFLAQPGGSGVIPQALTLYYIRKKR